jgi:PAS domain S-box-containing protein
MSDKKYYQKYKACRRENKPYQDHPHDTFKTFQNHNIHWYDLYVAAKDGNASRYHKSADVALRNESEKSDALTDILTGVTEHRETERKLRKAEQGFRAIFDNAADGIALADVKDKRFHVANKMFYHMLGYNPEDMENLGVVDIHPKQDLPYIMKQFEGQVDGELKLAKDIPVRRKDGSVFYVDIDSFPVALNGRTYLMGIFKDVTKRRRAEKQLKESERKLYSLIENFPDVILNLDRDGTILFINHTVPSYTVEETVGKSVYDFIPPEQQNRTREPIKKVFESGEVISFKTEIAGPDGCLIWYSTRLVPIRDGDEVVSVAQVSTDITETQKEEQICTFQAHMARAKWLASLGTLSATIAHKMTQPLTVVRLSLDDALDKLETTSSAPQNVTKEIKEALAQVSNLTSIVERFRNLAREYPEKMVSEVDVKAVTERIVKLLSESARRKRVILHLKEMDSLPPTYMNERDVEQLCFALIENAIQAADGKETRQLTVSGAVKGQCIELCFSDDCGGISQENLDRIFRPFFTTKPPGQGTGLGLCIVQEVVSRTGGRVHFESEFGAGSTFFVTLPFNEDRAL